MFRAFIVLQVVAILMAVAKLLVDEWEVSMVPVLMTGAAALIASGETKRYRELGQSYALTSQELEEQEVIAHARTEEAEFLEFIDIVEDAISREHTMWCVKRERSVPGGRA